MGDGSVEGGWGRLEAISSRIISVRLRIKAGVVQRRRRGRRHRNIGRRADSGFLTIVSVYAPTFQSDERSKHSMMIYKGDR